jgi:ectoine hydroxylase-related dioxygenase (phytanoyl-CoA dioxygenase family)
MRCSAAEPTLSRTWAWFLTAGQGWAAHRGVTHDVRDARGAPTLVNVWIAVTDVTKENACMHVVPLTADPHFPHAMSCTDVDRSFAVALPVPAGGVLAWNANALHWGGAMQPGAPPRASLSFTLSTGRQPPLPNSFEARVDLVAEMLLTYEAVASVPADWASWAKLWLGMRAARR